MDLLPQPVFLDPGPSLPEPGRAYFLGTTCDMRNFNCLANHLSGRPCSLPRSGPKRMETIDHYDIDDMGRVFFRAPAASLGLCPSLPSSNIHVNGWESQPRDACAAITSFLKPAVQGWEIFIDMEPNRRRYYGLDYYKTEGTESSVENLLDYIHRIIFSQHSSRNNGSIARNIPARHIDPDELVTEIKGIYAGLVIVETRCIQVDNTDTANSNSNSKADSKLNSKQLEAVITLHRPLLHESHDFPFESQHLSASAVYKLQVTKYAMPARMWKPGIRSFLKILRHSPELLKHMFILIECLSYLGRYRVAIEDDDIRDQEVWAGVSRHWYSKATEGHSTGRLYHHLAILARPDALRQLYYYTKSLCVPIPFSRAKESIMTLFGAPDKSPTTGDQYRRGKPPWRSRELMASSDAQKELLVHTALRPSDLSMLYWTNAMIADNRHGTDRHLEDLCMSPREYLVDLLHELLSSRETPDGSIKRKRLEFYWVCCAACFTTYLLGLIGSCISWLSLSLFEEHAKKTPRARRRSWVELDSGGLQKPALVDLNANTKPFSPSLLSFLCRSLQDFVLYACLAPFHISFFLLDTSLGILRLEGRFYKHTPEGLQVACLRRPFMDFTVGIPGYMAAQSLVLGCMPQYKWRRLYCERGKYAEQPSNV